MEIPMATKKAKPAANPMDAFMNQVGAKSGAVRAPTAAETAKNKQYAAYQQGANARAKAKAPALVPKKKSPRGNITGFKTRRKLGNDALGGW